MASRVAHRCARGLLVARLCALCLLPATLGGTSLPAQSVSWAQELVLERMRPPHGTDVPSRFVERSGLRSKGIALAACVDSVLSSASFRYGYLYPPGLRIWPPDFAKRFTGDTLLFEAFDTSYVRGIRTGKRVLVRIAVTSGSRGGHSLGEVKVSGTSEPGIVLWQPVIRGALLETAFVERLGDDGLLESELRDSLAARSRRVGEEGGIASEYRPRTYNFDSTAVVVRLNRSALLAPVWLPRARRWTTDVDETTRYALAMGLYWVRERYLGHAVPQRASRVANEAAWNFAEQVFDSSGMFLQIESTRHGCR